MATTRAATIDMRAAAGGSRRPWSPEAVWGTAMVVPYGVIFLAFVVWPVAYGVWLGADPAAYRTLLADPIYLRTAWNTALFLAVAINLKLVLALLLSGFLAVQRRWIRWLSVIFILPWAVPSIPTIFSIRWMLNSEWGMLNGLLWELFGIEGPWWLIEPQLAFGSVIATHIWKYLPFWTLILPGRPHGDLDRPLRGRDHRRGHVLAEVRPHHLAEPEEPLPHQHACSRRSGPWATSTASTCSPAAARPRRPTSWRRWASATPSTFRKSAPGSPR